MTSTPVGGDETYVIDRTVDLGARIDAASALVVLRDPMRLAEWLLAVDRVVPAADDTFRLVFAPGAQGSGTFLGALVDAQENRLTRVYRLPGTSDPNGTYRRTVTYRVLDGATTVLQAYVSTWIDGMSPKLRSAARSADERSVDVSFERLRDLLVGNRPGFLARRRAAAAPATPL